MKVIKAGYEILTEIDGFRELQRIESAARTCYKSEDRITADGESAMKMVRMLIKSGHEAMLEHSTLTVKFIVDRGVSHEIVRHRLASYAQESTRYANYSKDKFGSEITVIEPFFFGIGSDVNGKDTNRMYSYWYDSCKQAEAAYMNLLKIGATPQEARSVLPNSLKTELIMTANYREWRNFFRLRTATDAHPQIREIACSLLDELKQRIPVVFDDIGG